MKKINAESALFTCISFFLFYLSLLLGFQPPQLFVADLKLDILSAQKILVRQGGISFVKKLYFGAYNHGCMTIYAVKLLVVALALEIKYKGQILSERVIRNIYQCTSSTCTCGCPHNSQFTGWLFSHISVLYFPHQLV